jgi:hypothetical protein
MMGLVHSPLHGLVVTQAVHEPPQSSPVSVPFCTPSLHVAVAEMPTAVEIVVAPTLSAARAVNE